MGKKGVRSVTEALGRNIRLLRQARDWSQADLAERVGDTSTTVCRWESGKRIPTLPTLERIGAAFRILVPALLSPVRMIVEGAADEQSRRRWRRGGSQYSGVTHARLEQGARTMIREFNIGVAAIFHVCGLESVDQDCHQGGVALLFLGVHAERLTALRQEFYGGRLLVKAVDYNSARWMYSLLRNAHGRSAGGAQ